MDADAELHPLAQAQIQAHQVLAPQIAEEQRAHVVDLLETFERDIAPLIAPHARAVLDNPSLPAEWRPLFEQLADPPHFGLSVVIGFALGSTIGPVLSAAFQPEVEAIAQQSWKLTPTRVLTPDVLAAAALKGVTATGNAPPIPAGLADEALLSGITAERFATMVETAGQSIGLAEALLLFRRGDIDLAGITRILQYSDMNPRFYDEALKLQYGPPTAGEAITGRLKGHIDDAQAQALMRHAGIDPEDTSTGPIPTYDWLLASAGRPFTPHEVYQAIHRGYTGPITPEQALKQSDINETYAPLLPFFQYNYPSLFVIERALKAGTVTPERAAVILRYEGYEAIDIASVIQAAQSTATTTTHELSLAQITRLLQQNLITEADAIARIERHKFDAGTAQLVIELAQTQRVEQLQAATVRSIGTRYVAHKIPLVDVQTLLTRAGVPTAAQADLVALWDVERTANVHVPSPAAIVGAGRRQELTPAEVKVRLNQLGIADADLAIFVADGWPPGKALEGQAAAHAVVAGLTTWPAASGGPTVAPKRLTVTQISGLYTLGTIGKAEATTDLETLGYSATQAAELITTFTPHNPPIP